MNGKTLQVTFIGVLSTLCLILVTMTVLLCFGRIQLDLYKEIVTMLGIPTLIGVVVQSYLHSDANKDGIPDYQQIMEVKNGKTTIPINDAGNGGASGESGAQP